MKTAAQQDPTADKIARAKAILARLWSPGSPATANSPLVEELVLLSADIFAQHGRDLVYIARAEEKNAALNERLVDANNRLTAASRDVEQLLSRASITLQQSGDDFTRIRSLRDTLDPSVAIIGDGPARVVFKSEPRTAAVGG